MIFIGFTFLNIYTIHQKNKVEKELINIKQEYLRLEKDLNNIVGQKIVLEKELNERNREAILLSERNRELEKEAKKDKSGFNWDYDISSSSVIKRLQSD
jgi:hypothetical protein